MKKSLFWCSVMCCFGLLAGCDDDSSNVSIQDKCVPNDVKCENNAQSTCDSDGNWGTPVACKAETPVCDNDGKNCVATSQNNKCEQGQTKCENNALSTCDSDGNWGAPVACKAETPVCDNDGKNCVAASPSDKCEPGQTKCENNALSTCDSNGNWGAPVPCGTQTPVCDNDGKTCVAASPSDKCELGQTKCSDNHDAVLSCNSDGNWDLDTPSNCMFDSVCNDATKKCECTPDDQYCGGSGKGEGVYICNENKEYQFSTEIGSCTCKSDHSGCEDRCQPDEKKCSSDHSAVLTCNANGGWDDNKTIKCDKNFTCDDNSAECLCEPGKEICTLINSDSEGMYKCGDDGKIHSTQSLIKYCECNQEQTACADSEEKCENGERKCDGQSVMVCKNNTWTEDRECTRNSYCNTEAGVICIPRFINQGVCDQSESVCNGQTLMKCENGLYKSVQPECGENQCVQSYCITSNLSEGSHAAQYEKTCRNTSYCIGTRKITCDINGGVSEDLCGGKSEVCILAESALDAAITATCAVPKCNEHIFYCDGDSLSYCFENNKIKLADCSQFGLVCKEGYGGGCVPGGNKI